MGRRTAPLGQMQPDPRGFLCQNGPHRSSEGPQLLNPPPAGHDCLQRWRGQGTLTSVVEVSLVGQGRAEISQAKSGWVVQDRPGCSVVLSLYQANFGEGAQIRAPLWGPTPMNTPAMADDILPPDRAVRLAD